LPETIDMHEITKDFVSFFPLKWRWTYYCYFFGG